jgi:multidrug efflux system outer membrane protein
MTTNAPLARDLKWQQFFTDEKLRQVIAAALTNNRDLRVAVLNVELARAKYGIQRAELWPAIDATGSASKQRIPGNTEGFPQPMTIQNYSANLGVASWEIDLFGRIRNLKDEALENYLATEQARRGTQISLISSVANAYLTQAADQESLALADRTLQSQRDSFVLVKRRYDLGLATELDLQQAQSQVDSAQTDIARFTRSQPTAANGTGCHHPSQGNRSRSALRSAPATTRHP